MGENERLDDAGFVNEILKGLPSTPVSAALEARILADFDRVTVRRRFRPAAIMTRISERLWPGVPAWQPVSVLALSLVVGLTAGAFLPATSSTSTDLSVVAAETVPDFDMDKDS